MGTPSKLAPKLIQNRARGWTTTNRMGAVKLDSAQRFLKSGIVNHAHKGVHYVNMTDLPLVKGTRLIVYGVGIDAQHVALDL